MALRLGVSANTLQHKLNPANDRHILGLKEALLLQLLTGNASVLHAMAKALGYTCTRATPSQAEGDPFEAFRCFQQEVGEFTAAAADALRGDSTSRNAQRRAEYQAQELIAATCGMTALIAERVPQHRG